MRKAVEALESPGFKISADPLHSALGSIQFSLPKTTFVLDWILSIWLSGWAGPFCILCPLQLSILIADESCSFDWGSRAVLPRAYGAAESALQHCASTAAWKTAGTWESGAAPGEMLLPSARAGMLMRNIEIWGCGGYQWNVGSSDRLREWGWPSLTNRRTGQHLSAASCSLMGGCKKVTSWWEQATCSTVTLGSSCR